MNGVSEDYCCTSSWILFFDVLVFNLCCDECNGEHSEDSCDYLLVNCCKYAVFTQMTRTPFSFWRDECYTADSSHLLFAVWQPSCISILYFYFYFFTSGNIRHTFCVSCDLRMTSSHVITNHPHNLNWHRTERTYLFATIFKNNCVVENTSNTLFNWDFIV